MARTTTESRGTLLLVAALLVLAGCGAQGTELVDDTGLSERLGAVVDTGGPVALRDVAAGDWDEVRVFDSYASPDSVEDELGTEIDVDAWVYESAQVVAFLRDGVVQRLVRVRPLLGPSGSYGADVVLRARAPGAGPLSLDD